MSAVRIALFEIRYLLRLPRIYFLFVLFLFLGFFLSPLVDPRVFGAGSGANVNSPFFVTAIHLGCCLVAALVLPPYLSASLRRDVDCRFAEIVFTTPTSETAYLSGRFLGVYAALMFAASGLTLGMALSNVWLPWAPATLGATHPSYYANAYFLFTGPTMLIIATLISSVLVASGSSIYTYLAVAVLILCSALAAIVRGVSEGIASVIDPFLIAALTEKTRYWTPAELNSSAIGYGASFLKSRILWISIAAGSALLARRSFSFRSAATGRAPRDAVVAGERVASTPIAEQLDRSPVPRWTTGTTTCQLLWRIALELKAVCYGRPFLALVVASVIALYLLLPSARSIYGAPVFPLTRLLLESIMGVLPGPMLIVLIYGTTEIVWRERTYQVHEIVDSMPVPSWVLAVSKFLSLIVVLAGIVTLAIAVAVSIQVFNGYYDLQLGTHVERGLFFLFLPAVSFAALALLGQVLAPGWFAGLLPLPAYALVSFGLGLLGYNHPLMRLGSTIPAPLSDMNDSGQFMSGTYWLSLYWSCVAALLVLLASVLWNRGSGTPLRHRIGRLRVNRGFVAGAAVMGVLALATGSYIYYNVSVLNRFLSSRQVELRRVTYERRFRQYEGLLRPRVREIDVSLDFYPEQARFDTRTSLMLANTSGEDISEIHLDFPDVVDASNVEAEEATVRSRNGEFGYYILTLDPPMRPGDTRSISFDASFRARGFQAGGPNLGVVNNGSYLRYTDFAPHFGYNPDYAISDPTTRQKYGLSPLRPSKRAPDAAEPLSVNDIAQDSDRVRFSATVSTAPDQIAVTAGTLTREWQEGGRRFFRYVLDGPSKISFAFLSGKYSQVQNKLDGIDIQILYHHRHTANLDRMLESIADSLRYYSNAFGPYQFRQLRIVEIPAYYTFAQSNPGTITYSPGLGFITKPAKPGEVDVPYYVTAHEVAHQWWGQQIVTNNSQGDLLLSETLAQYSALLVMEKTYGRDLVRTFLKAELDLYLRGRGSDERGELPLIRVEDQSYIYYRKGGVVMYALRDYVGEDVINSALRKLIDAYGPNSHSFPTSRSLVENLKAEAGPEHRALIEDLFERITMYDVKLRAASVDRLPNGRFRTTIDVSAAKYYASAAGEESGARFDIPIDVGLFVRSPGDRRFTRDDVIWLEKQRVVDGESTLEVTVDRMPAVAGIDPYNMLVDRNSDDNLLGVDVRGTSAHPGN